MRTRSICNSLHTSTHQRKALSLAAHVRRGGPADAVGDADLVEAVRRDGGADRKEGGPRGPCAQRALFRSL
jgi:hypothetical protein